MHLSNVKKNPESPHVYQEGEEVFVKNITDNTLIGYKYFQFEGECLLEVTTRGADGRMEIWTEDRKLERQKIGTIFLNKSIEWNKSNVIKINLEGKKPLYFIYKGKEKIDFLKFHLK